jgi:hypothetical protein
MPNYFKTWLIVFGLFTLVCIGIACHATQKILDAGKCSTSLSSLPSMAGERC